MRPAGARISPQDIHVPARHEVPRAIASTPLRTSHAAPRLASPSPTAAAEDAIGPAGAALPRKPMRTPKVVKYSSCERGGGEELRVPGASSDGDSVNGDARDSLRDRIARNENRYQQRSKSSRRIRQLTTSIAPSDDSEHAAREEDAALPVPGSPLLLRQTRLRSTSGLFVKRCPATLPDSDPSDDDGSHCSHSSKDWPRPAPLKRRAYSRKQFRSIQN